MTNDKTKTILPLAVAVVVMLSAGYVQGVWSERWGSFPELEILSEQLAHVPRQIGEWQGTDSEKLDEKVKEIAGAEGEMTRVYRNASGEEVRVSIICGRLQHVTDHTPDRCYPAAGFEMLGEPQHDVVDYDGGSAEFFTTSFRKSEATGTHGVRGYWTLSGDGNWQAADNPKFAFADQQHAVYKLYIFAEMPVDHKPRPGDRDFCRDFIREFIPALNASLQPGFDKAGRGSEEAPVTSAPEAPAAEGTPAA